MSNEAVTMICDTAKYIAWLFAVAHLLRTLTWDKR